MEEGASQGVLLTLRLAGGKPWGFTAKEIFKDNQTTEVLLIISKVDPNGKSAGMVVTEDILLAIDGTPCRTVIDARNQIEEANSQVLSLTVWRKGSNKARPSLKPVEQSAPVLLPKPYRVHEEATPETSPARKDSPENHTDTDGQSNSDVIVSEIESEIAASWTGERASVSPVESQLTMDHRVAAPEATLPMSQHQASGAAGQRASLSSLRSSQLYPFGDDSMPNNHSDLIMSSSNRRPRQSIDAYPMCGLPSGTLYRKSTSSASLRPPSSTPMDMPYMKPSSGSHPVAPSVFRPIRNSLHSNTPDDLLSLFPPFTSPRRENSGPPTLSYSPLHSKTSPTNPIANLTASALGAKSQKMMELLNSHAGATKNIYHATPTAQWSQTESSAAVYRDLTDEAAYDRQKRQPPKSQSHDVTNLSATFRSVPALTSRLDAFVPLSGSTNDSSRPGTEQFPENCCDFNQRLSGGKDNTAARIPLAPINKQGDKQKATTSGFIKPMVVRPRGANNAPGTAPNKGENCGASGAKPTDIGIDLREARKMPAFRPHHFLNPAEDPSVASGKSPHLTTVKEVRTYQIRPSLNSAEKESLTGSSSSTNGTGSPNSIRSSASSSTSEEYRHSRDASLDSHVSWHSNSTNSSGYSSVALSSSTPTLDLAVSEETLVPAEYYENFQESDAACHGDLPVSRSDRKTAISSPPTETEKQHRSISVSEMIRNFGDPIKTPPNPPPKPRYALLPAHRPDVAPSTSPKIPFERSRGNSIPNSVSFTSMEDLRLAGETQQTRRASCASTPTNIPIRVEPAERKESIFKQNSPPLSTLPVSHQSRWNRDAQTLEKSGSSASSVKPVPMFRTAVHGLVLGGSKNLPDRKIDQQTVIPEEAPATQSAPFEDRGYGSGEIHQISDFSSVLEEDSAKNSSLSTLVPPKHGALDADLLSEDRVSNLESLPDQDLLQARENLTARLADRIPLLKEEQNNIQQDTLANEELGEEISEELSKVASPQDMEKYRQHLKELEEMTSLTMSLTSRLEKVNLCLSNLRAPADDLEVSTLQAKKRKLESQYQDALYLQKGVERRRQTMRRFLSQCLSEKQFEDYEEFFATKMNLLRETRNLDDKIRLGEEQLRCLRYSAGC